MERSSQNWRRWVAAFMLAMAVSHTVVFWQERKLIATGYGDFSAFYTAGTMLRKGLARELYDPQEQWKVQQEFASQVAIRKGPMPFVRPPFEAVLFFPLSFFSYPVALAIWSIVKLAGLWLALRLLPRDTPFTNIYPPWFEGVLCLGFFPIFLDFYQGQDAVLLLLLVVAALRSLLFRKDAAAGLFLALGLFKFHLVVPIVIVLALARRPRVLVGFLPAAVALVASSGAVGGGGIFYAYPAYLLNLNQAPGVGMVTAQSMPNLRGLLTAWIGRAPYPGPIHWMLFPVAVAALLCAAWLWRGARTSGFQSLVLGYSFTLVAVLLTSYYAYSYDLTLLLIPVLLLGSEFPGQATLSALSRRLIVSALLALICAPLYWGLILRLDRPYLLVIPLAMLGLGIAIALRQPGPFSEA